MNKNYKMNCPSCGTKINVDQILVNQFEDSIRKELQAELQRRESELSNQQNEYKRLLQEVEKKQLQVEDMVNERVKETVKVQQDKIRKQIEKEITEERSSQLQELEDELESKSRKLREFHKTKSQLERLRREMEEKEAQIVLQKEEELSERLEAAKLSIKEQAHQESFLKLKEREKVINDLKKQLEDARRRAEQGSMQLQGEIQEQEIKVMLEELYTTDVVEQTKKGTNGADLLQTVKVKTGKVIGSIYYESKRTKAFQKGWIKKFKQDNLKQKADVLVLVSSALPEGIEKYDLIDGVWVCSMNHVKELSLVLRYGLLKVHEVKIVQDGKGSKMELLYDYLASEEFKSIFESIIEGFKEIQDSHQSEKMKMQRLWKQREKQLEQVLRNAVEFYGSLKGIAGDSIADIGLLEMPKAS